MRIESLDQHFERKRTSQRHFLLPLLKEAIRKINPGDGLTITDLYKYAKSKVDYDSSKLKSGVLAALKSGIHSGLIVKQDRYRYGLKGRTTADEIVKLCGTCGGRMKKKRRGCSKPRRRRRSCKRRTKKRSCRRKSRRRRSCRKKRRSCRRRRRSSCNKCPKKRRRRSCKRNRRRSSKPRRKSCIRRCNPGSGQEIPSEKMSKKNPTPPNSTKP